MTLLFVFRIGSRLASTEGGLAAAALMAVAFLPVRDSHFGTTDASATLAVVIAIDAMTAASTARRPTIALGVAGLFAGVGAAIKYLPAILLIPILVSACVGARRRPSGRRFRHAALCCAAAAGTTGAAFLAGAPYTILAFPEFRRGFAAQARQSFGAGIDPIGTAWTLLAKGLPVAVGLPLAVVGVLAILWAVRGPAARRLVALAIAIYVAILSLATFSLYRYLLPVVALLCVLVGSFCSDVAGRLGARWRAVVLATIVIALGAEPLLRSIAIVRLFTRETTFEEVAAVIAVQPDHPPVCAPCATKLGSLGYLPLDPLGWPAGRDVLLLIARHPHPVIGDEWTPLRGAIESSPSARKLHEVQAFRDFHGTRASFEVADWFLYPVAGFEGVERGGPDLLLYRIRRGAALESRGAPIPPPSVIVDRSSGRLRLRLAPSGHASVVTHYVRFQAGAIPAPDGWSRPQPYAAGLNEVALPAQIQPGRYHVSVASATLDGAGPWSAATPVDVP
jgi:hypothetical protein